MRPWLRATLATILVAVLPVAAVWALSVRGVVTSPWITVPLALALVLIASWAADAYWKRRPASGDVLFSDLLLWGWLRRTRAERRLANARELLGRAGSTDEAESLRTLEKVAEAIDAKDPYLDGHSRRVARFSSRMVKRLGLPDDEADRVRTAAAIHDVGKLHVPAAILAKPGALTRPELAAMHRHADEGAAMVACLGDPEVTEIVRHHHERFDGGGYPSSLSGEAIPLGARIVAVADTFDAITSARPYRPAGTHKQALEVLEAEAGTQLDPVVVRAFVREYARRRGLVLWTLLAMPVAAARRHPLPAAVALGGLVVLGAAATAVRIAGNADHPAAAKGPVPPAAVQIAARPTHPRKAHHARHRAVVASTARATAAGSKVVVAAATTPHRVAPTPRPRATQHQHQHQPAAQHLTTRAPSPVAIPRRRGTPPPQAPPPPRTPPATTPPAPAPATNPAPTTSPPPAPTTSPPPPVSTPSAPPPAPTGADACKKGGYSAGGYRNQGQCVASSHHP